MKALFSICLLTFGLQGAAQSTPASPSIFSETSKQQLVRQYLDAYNGGEQKTRQFWEMVSPSDTPVEERVSRYQKLFSNLGAITPIKILNDAPGDLDVLVRSASGETLEMMFEVGEGAKPALKGVRIEQFREGAPSDTQSSPKPEHEVLEDIKRLLASKVAADEFAGTILIAKGPNVIFQAAYGLADQNFGIPNEMNTRFDSGSIAKSFTRTATAQLVEKGKLHLEDTIGQYLPTYPNEKARDHVTIAQLLDMRSGIADFFGTKFERTPRGDIRSLSDYLPLFASEPLAFEPGTKRAYSNGGFIVLGLIIEKASGETYYDYVQRHVFAPAGMVHSDFSFSDMRHDHEATGYTKTGESVASFQLPANQRRANDLVMPARGSSAGSARTTAGDLFLYSRALVTNSLVKPSTAETMGISGSAMGIAGGAPGINAVLETGIRGVGPDDYTLAIMSNYDPPSAEDLGKAVRGMLRSAK
jgi:CubicO group peptidase (beta-lactamase class C family)